MKKISVNMITHLRLILIKLVKLSEIDFHIGITLAFRLWSIAAGGVLLLLIPLFLTNIEQGYYFTFSSLIATQVFFELGFNSVIVQMVGHEMAGLNYTCTGQLKGNVYNLGRMTNLIELLKRWYSTIAILFFIAISVIGFYFFTINGALPLNKWLPVWLLLVFFSALNLFFSPFLAVIEGMGLVGHVARVRLIQSIIGYGGLFFMLYINAGLFAIPFISGSACISSCVWLYKKHRVLFFSSCKNNHTLTEKISWQHEIFPFQWRIALSWLSGYFIFQLFSPLIFANQGEIEAGRIGLTLTIFTTMLSLSMSWVTAKSPTMAKLIAQNNFQELNILFKSVTLKSGAVNLLITTLFVMSVLFFKKINMPVVDRLANTHILFLLLIVSVANHLIFSTATYMRAHKVEPMTWNSVGTGLLIAPIVYYASKINSTATIAGYAAVILFVCLPWTMIIFRKFINLQNIRNENNK